VVKLPSCELRNGQPSAVSTEALDVAANGSADERLAVRRGTVPNRRRTADDGEKSH